ncbi:hypothetical protein D9M70_603310 [compost metagenome]
MSSGLQGIQHIGGGEVVIVMSVKIKMSSGVARHDLVNIRIGFVGGHDPQRIGQ